MTELCTEIIPLQSRHDSLDHTFIKGIKKEKELPNTHYIYIAKNHMLHGSWRKDHASFYGGGVFLKTDAFSLRNGFLIINNKIIEVHGTFKDKVGAGVWLANNTKHYVHTDEHTIIEYRKHSDVYAIAFLIYQAIETGGKRDYKY